MSLPIKVLVVDDDPELRELIIGILPEHYEVIEAGDASSGLQQVAAAEPDILLLDLDLGEGPDGFFVLEHLRRHDPELPVVILSAHKDTDTVVRAMKTGAAHYITKPPRQDELVERLRFALADRRRAFALAAQRVPGEPRIIGTSSLIREVVNLAQAAAKSELPVLILGETGSGKSLVARCVHQWSARKSNIYRDVNVAGLSTSVLDSELFGHERGAFTGAERRRRGLFELTSGGTLLLDEVGDLPPECQVKLLKVVEEGTFRRVGGEDDLHCDVRILAATHRTLDVMMAEGTFRQDLYHRLAGLVIRVPPLRDHPEDIPDLVRDFLGEDLSLTEEAQNILVNHEWPGNVRELQQTLRRASLFAQAGNVDSGHINLEPLRTLLQAENEVAGSDLLDLPFNEATRKAANRFRRMYIERLLSRHKGNVSQVARECGISRPHLHTLIRKLGLDK